MKIKNYDYLKRFNKKPTKANNKKVIEAEIVNACERQKKNGDTIIFLTAKLKTNQELTLTYDEKYASGIETLRNRNKVKITYWTKTILAPTGEEEITYNNISKIEALQNEEDDDFIGDLEKTIDADIYAF